MAVQRDLLRSSYNEGAKRVAVFELARLMTRCKLCVEAPRPGCEFCVSGKAAKGKRISSLAAESIDRSVAPVQSAPFVLLAMVFASARSGQGRVSGDSFTLDGEHDCGRVCEHEGGAREPPRGGRWGGQARPQRRPGVATWWAGENTMRAGASHTEPRESAERPACVSTNRGPW